MTVLETFKATDLIAFQVKFLQLGAVFKAIHFLNHIAEQVNLLNVFASFESRLPNEGQVVVLQKDVGQFGAQLAKQGLNLVRSLVNCDEGGYPSLLHHEVSHIVKIRQMELSGLFLSFTQY